MRRISGPRLQDQHELLRAAVNDPEVCLGYSGAHRSYGIFEIFGSMARCVHVSEWNGAPSSMRYDIDYCPWSGLLLPGRLSFQRQRLLAKIGGIGLYDLNHFEEVPDFLTEEFKSEAWWVNRGIDVKPRPRFGPRSWKPRVYRVRYRDEMGLEIPPGLYRSIEEPPHLCETMAGAMSHVCTMITYIPWTREYGIRKLAWHRYVDYQPIRMVKIDYCPWCGTKLPSSLKQAWYDQLSLMRIDPNHNFVPPYMLSDKWWRILGL
ncbi:MAG: hypothetical protein RIM33_14535 [Alphaproteobacteria bacterium]